MRGHVSSAALATIASASLAALLSAQAPPEQAPASTTSATTVSFARDVQPVLERKPCSRRLSGPHL
jgi:hypothetical protein